MEASLLIPSLLVNCTLNSLAKSLSQCCKLSLKSPEGSGYYDIYIYILHLHFSDQIQIRIFEIHNLRVFLGKDLKKAFLTSGLSSIQIIGRVFLNPYLSCFLYVCSVCLRRFIFQVILKKKNIHRLQFKILIILLS